MTTLLTTSNAASGVTLISSLGFHNEAELFSSYQQAPDLAKYEYAHIVLGARGGPPPKALSLVPGLRIVRDVGTTWIGGTFASWWRALDTDDVPGKWRTAIMTSLTRVTNLGCFGNPKYLSDVPEWIEIPTAPVSAPLAEAWGGIVSVALDPTAEADFVAAGARILQRGGEGKLPWASVLPAETPARRAVAGGDGPAVTLIGGALAWPFPSTAISDKEREALDGFEKAYKKARASVKSEAALSALRLPFEVAPLLMVVDGVALTKASGSAHPMTVHAAQEIRAGLVPAPEPHAGKAKVKGAKATGEAPLAAEPVAG